MYCIICSDLVSKWLLRNTELQFELDGNVSYHESIAFISVTQTTQWINIACTPVLPLPSTHSPNCCTLTTSFQSQSTALNIHTIVCCVLTWNHPNFCFVKIFLLLEKNMLIINLTFNFYSKFYWVSLTFNLDQLITW